MNSRRGAIAGVVLFVIASLIPGQAATADPAEYVALGDSYASGVGTRTYLDDGTTCRRSPLAYPSLLSAAKGYDLNFRACSGAKIADVRGQLSALSASTTYVTLSVGGNDAGFTSVLTECLQPAFLSDCNGVLDESERVVRDVLPAQLGALYTDIKAKAPNAAVTVVGYPRLFMGRSCNIFTFFSKAEQARLSEGSDLLNSVAAEQARRVGFAFADPTEQFLGHAICGSPEWINNLTLPIQESFHPNRSGHSLGLLPVVSPLVGGSVASATSTTVQRSLADAPQQAELQSTYAAKDARIEPETVGSVDLTSARAKARAKRAGVDLRDWAQVQRADRAAAAEQRRALLANR